MILCCFVRLLALLPPPLAGVDFVIDLGHGGNDSGMSWLCYTEAACVPKLGIELAPVLESHGARVRFTTWSKKIQHEKVNQFLQPTDAVYTVNHHPVHAGVHGCSVRTNGWGGKGRSVIFVSFHIDSIGSHVNARGGVLYHGLHDRETPFMRCLAAEMRAHHIDRWQDGMQQRTIQAEDLFIFNNENAAHLPEKMLYEIGVPACSARDQWLITTKAGRLRIIDTILKALLKWRRLKPS